MVYENIELLPSGDSYELSLGNNYPTDSTMIFLVVIPVRNKRDWVEVSKKD